MDFDARHRARHQRQQQYRWWPGPWKWPRAVCQQPRTTASPTQWCRRSGDPQATTSQSCPAIAGPSYDEMNGGPLMGAPLWCYLHRQWFVHQTENQSRMFCLCISFYCLHLYCFMCLFIYVPLMCDFVTQRPTCSATEHYHRGGDHRHGSGVKRKPHSSTAAATTTVRPRGG